MYFEIDSKNESPEEVTMNKQKLFFLHIPKTAGHSISDSLSRIATQKRLTMLGPVLIDHLKEYPKWAESDILVGHLGLLPLDFNYEYFTVLRDPLERLYSHYSHIKRGKSHYFGRIVVEKKLDFEHYLLDERFARINFNMQTRYLSSKPILKTAQITGHHQEQCEFFENSHESNVNLEIAIDTLSKAAWVGSSINFRNLELFLEKRYAISGVEIPRLNVRPGPRRIFTSREKKAAEPFIEFDQLIYSQWGSGSGKDDYGSNLGEVRYRQSKNLGGMIAPIKSGLVKLLSRIHLIGVARIIWRALVRLLK